MKSREDDEGLLLLAAEEDVKNWLSKPKDEFTDSFKKTLKKFKTHTMKRKAKFGTLQRYVASLVDVMSPEEAEKFYLDAATVFIYDAGQRFMHQWNVLFAHQKTSNPSLYTSKRSTRGLKSSGSVVKLPSDSRSKV